MKKYQLLSCLALTIICTTCITLAGQSYILEKLGGGVNTNLYNEISPITDDEGKVLFFTRTSSPDFSRQLIIDSVDVSKKLNSSQYEQELSKVYSQLGGSGKGLAYNSPFNQDVWIARSPDGELFVDKYHPGPPLNNALPNSICSYTPQSNVFVVINQFPKSGGMKGGFSLIKMINDSLWTNPTPINILDFNSKSEVVSFTMSFDGSVAIMSLDRFDSHGSNDLYVTTRIDDSTWSSPKNLGNINSVSKDVTPFLSPDMKTLYFGSNRAGSMGGYDIFMSKRGPESWEDWSTPLPLIEPINSKSDDSQPLFNKVTGYFYFSSKRDGTSDIFRVRIADPNPQETTIYGKIIDSKTLRPIASEIYIGREGQNNFEKVIPSSDGDFVIVANKKDVIKIYPYKENYISREEIIHVSELPLYGNATELKIYIDAKKINSRISVNPIYFQQSKAIILEKSLAELDRLYEILRNNPTMNIRVEGHTDNLGNPEDLQLLSEQRAEAVKDYLIKKGIKMERLAIIGFGARRPVNTKKPDEYRELNRRVEFIITKI